MTAFLVELRRSPLRWWLPVFVGLDLAVLLGRSREWEGVWPQASAAAQLPAFFLSPVLAAAAAWAAGREQRAGAAEQFAATGRPEWQRQALQLGVTVCYGLGGLVPGAAVAAALTVGEGGPGFLWPSYLVLAASLLIIFAAFGHVVGRRFSSRLMPPLVAGSVFAVFSVVSPILGITLFVLSGPPQSEITLAALGARVFLAVTVVAVAIVGIPAPRTRRWASSRTGLAAGAALAALTAALVTLPSSGALRVERAAPHQPLCSDSTPRVCLWPEQRKYLATITAMAGRLGGLSETVKVPDTFYEEGLRAPLGTNSDFPVVLGTYAVARSMAGGVLGATLPELCRTASQRELGNRIELLEWLVRRTYGAPQPADEHGGFDYDKPKVEGVLAAPFQRQAAWAKAQIVQIRAARCADS